MVRSEDTGRTDILRQTWILVTIMARVIRTLMTGDVELTADHLTTATVVQGA